MWAIIKAVAVGAVVISVIYYNRNKSYIITETIPSYAMSLYTSARLLVRHRNKKPVDINIMDQPLKYSILSVIGYNDKHHNDCTDIFKVLFSNSDNSFGVSDEIMDTMYMYDNFVIYYSFMANQLENSSIDIQNYAIIIPAKAITNFTMPAYTAKDLELANGVGWEDIWDQVIIKTDEDIHEVEDCNVIDTLVMHAGPLKDYYESVMPDYLSMTNWKTIRNYINHDPILLEPNSTFYITSSLGQTKRFS